MPPGFTWVDRPGLAALAMPDSADDLKWLRRNGVEVLVSLTEDAPPRGWVNDAGLLCVHVPIEDMTAPTPQQFERCLAAIDRARTAGLAVAVHCAAGKGRTGAVLAAYFVGQGMTASAAIDHVRDIRPGSVETPDQEAAVEQYAAERAKARSRG